MLICQRVRQLVNQRHPFFFAFGRALEDEQPFLVVVVKRRRLFGQ